ncbi:hypothetical protein ACUL41_16350 [Virgibacillus natechei]
MNYNSAGIAFVGCILLGSGIGMLFGNVAAWAAIGVGGGLISLAVLSRKS